MQLVEDGKRDCWAVRFEQGGRTVQAPLRVPDGYMAADIVMAELLRLVREEGSSALIATHNERLALKMDRVVRLSEGVLA